MRRLATLPLASLLASLVLTTTTPATPVLAATPHLNDNRGVSGPAIAVSAALSAVLLPLIGVPVVVSGRVLSNPKIHNLYWDDNWDSHNPTAPTRATINDFTNKLAGSHYFDPANQYGVHSGSFTGDNQSSSLCGPRRPGATTSFLAILAWATCEAGGVDIPFPNPVLPGFPLLTQGLPALSGVPAPDDNSLYVVYLPKGTTIKDFGLTSCVNYGAYHFMSAVPETEFAGIFPFPTIQSFAFAVEPADCASTVDGLSQLVSHEVIEGSTDPIFGLGWIDNSQFDLNHIVNIATLGEAADICALTVPTSPVRLTNGVSVVPYWSNTHNACEPQAPSTSLSAGAPTVSINGVTYVTSHSFINLTATPPPGAARAGDALVTSFRFWRTGTAMPDFQTCPSNPCVFLLDTNDGQDGRYEVDFFTTDMTNGIVEETNTQFLTLDNTAPQSTLTIGTPQFTGAQLFVRNITPFMVTATDSGSGVGSISYRFFPQGGVAPAYSTVLGASANFLLSGPDGIYEVDTLATDRLGNAETAHTRFVQLDDTPPVITIVQPAATNYTHSTTLTLNYSVSDGTGSGVNHFTATLDGATTLAGHGLASGQSINLLTELTLGTHTFAIFAVDNVGNTSTSAVTFTIIATAQSIKDDVHQFLASGAIKNAGLANSLLAKLDAAANAAARGNCVAASNIYEAFIQELQAQSGKGVSATAAAIMISDAEYLIAHCPGGRAQ